MSPEAVAADGREDASEAADDARVVVVALVGITALAALLRFPTLGLQSYWYDEVFTVDAVDGSLAHLWTAVAEDESTPPLYYLAAWVWANVLGTGEAALRSLSAVASTAMVPVAYLAGRALVSRRVGLAAALLAAVSPLLVWYGQEARSYALVALLSAGALAAFGEALRRPERWWPLLTWGVLSALALATHYFALFALLPQLGWLLVRHPRPARALVSAVPVLATGLALLPLALDQARGDQTGWISVIPLATRAKATLVELLWHLPPIADGGAVVALGVGALSGLLIWRYAQADERRGALLALGTAVATVAIPFALALAGRDYVIARNLVVAWLPLAVFVSTGVAARRAGWVGHGALGLLVASSLALVAAGWTQADRQRHDWRAAADAVGSDAALLLLGDYPVGQRIAIAHYAPDLEPVPTDGTPVREVVAVGYAFGGTAESRYRLPRAFAVVERRLLSGLPPLYLTRYRAPAPLRLRPADVIVLEGERPEVLVRSPREG